MNSFRGNIKMITRWQTLLLIVASKHTLIARNCRSERRSKRVAARNGQVHRRVCENVSIESYAANNVFVKVSLVNLLSMSLVSLTRSWRRLNQPRTSSLKSRFKSSSWSRWQLAYLFNTKMSQGTTANIY